MSIATLTAGRMGRSARRLLNNCLWCLNNYLHPVKALYSAYHCRYRPANSHFQSFTPDNLVYSLAHLPAGGIELIEAHVPHNDNRQSPERRQITALSSSLTKPSKSPATANRIAG